MNWEDYRGTAGMYFLSRRGVDQRRYRRTFRSDHGASISKDTISKITDKIVEEMTGWFNQPLEPVYVAVFIDALQIKVRDGQVSNRPFYAAIGVDLDGHKDDLGLWQTKTTASPRSSGTRS